MLGCCCRRRYAHQRDFTSPSKSMAPRCSILLSAFSVRFVRYALVTPMAKFAGVPLRALNERLGQPCSTRRSGGSHAMFWDCSRTAGIPVCYAQARAEYQPTPRDLTPFEEELFDNTPPPEAGWTITPCPQHRDTFADYAKEPD